MTSPCNAAGEVNPATTVAKAKNEDADEIYKAGVAQAIAALAFGTKASQSRQDRRTWKHLRSTGKKKLSVRPYQRPTPLQAPAKFAVAADGPPVR